MVCGLPDADRQRSIDKFKSLGIDKTKCAYEITIQGRSQEFILGGYK